MPVDLWFPQGCFVGIWVEDRLAQLVMARRLSLIFREYGDGAEC